ncbi:MAG: hypothetical protein NC418_03690 [Muribaculaceae bacterium]|nr:hypothetical protein [Muribaculaceae bacterium]
MNTEMNSVNTAHKALRSIALFLILAVCANVAAAQADVTINDSERDRIFNEMRAYKHKFLAKELALDKDQQRDFFPVYDRMDEQLQKISRETRELERSVAANTEATDTEIEAAAAAVYSQKMREGKVEEEYFEQFKDILSPRQLLRLKSAEKKFTQKLVRQHRKLQKAQ